MAKKIANDRSGSCDLCGQDLRNTKWVEGEVTTCSLRCLTIELAEAKERELGEKKGKL